jgi:uncharacterized protein YuzE
VIRVDSQHKTVVGYANNADAAYITMVNPKTILELLDALEAK